MNVLVFGAEGQLGRAIGMICPNFVRLTRDEADLQDPASILRAMAEVKPDVLVNAAAYTAVDHAERDADLANAVNAEAIGTIAAACERAATPFIHFSTDYVFDGRKDGAWLETDVPAPINVYGQSKRAGEILALERASRSVIIRTSWVYSPWGRNFVRTMLGLAARERVSVVSDQVGSPTSALDLARLTSRLVGTAHRAPRSAAIWGIWHYAGLGSVSWAGFAEAIFSEARAIGLIDQAPAVQPIPSAAYPTAAARPANSVLDCSAIENKFGIEREPWRAGLRETLGILAGEAGRP